MKILHQWFKFIPEVKKLSVPTSLLKYAEERLTPPAK
jgi:hypothetical protein